ncbi:MAG TPA: DUF6785 family protein [Armatimonadota bacterium]|nr:DUF6785 family protein [Armatimonadota bacterium]
MQAPETVDDSARRGKGVTWRSVLIGLILIPPNCVWVVQVEIVHYSGHPTCLSIFSNAVFSLFLVILFNLALRRIRPQWALTQGELLTSYIMVALGASVAAHDMLQMLVPTMAHGHWFATPENKWEQLIHPHLSEWLIVTDQHALEGYHEGRTSILDSANYVPWLKPLFWWGTFVLTLIFVMQCINSVMRKQWTESEKLTYPLIQLPVEMTRSGGASGLYVGWVFWFGFAAGAGLDLYNGTAFLVPSIPQLNVKLTNLSHYFSGAPWNAVGWFPVSYYPFVVGLSFFLPQDVSFSCWFFYLFRKAIQVFAAATGWGQLAGAPFLIEQAWGAWMAFAGLAAYSARRHLAMVWKTIRNQPGGIDDSREPMRYRFAVGGVALGLAYLTAFWVKAGGSIWPIGLYFILYYALFSAVSKMRAEIGPPTHELGSMATTRMVGEIFGTKSLGAGTLVSFAMLWFNNRMVRSHQMPIQLEGFKMAERSGIDYKRLAWAMMAAVTLGLLSGYWALLSDAYNSKGARGTGFAGESFRQLQGWLIAPRGPEPLHIAFIGGGAVFALLLGAARMRITGWPFHPAGYALGMVFGLDYVWMPILIAWASKGLLLRYGGLRAHAAVIPFICGLILGEFVVGSFWSSLSVLLDKPMYTFWIF